MLRMLVFSLNPARGNEAADVLRASGLECLCENAADEEAFRRALALAPDLIVVDDDASDLPAQVACDLAKAALPDTPCVRVTRATLGQLGDVIRSQLAQAGIPTRRSSDQVNDTGLHEASAIAQQLLERRAALEEYVPPQERSTLASVLRRTPPNPAALVCIADPKVRARYLKCLATAGIAMEEARDANTALARIDTHAHAVLFTDELALIGRVRKLYAGSATHIVFVDSNGSVTEKAALDAGANDWLDALAEGPRFWARLTTAHRIVSLASSLQLALADNQILSTVDELTRTGSRRFFERQFPREVELASRRERPVALIMTDIDHFKRVNDTYGHPAGDEVLREFARRLFQGLRHREDWVARVGGEEFAIVLPEAGEAEALAVADRLHLRVSEHPMTTARGPLDITASFGVCAAVPPRPGAGYGAKMAQVADTALYQSKREGRNRITVGSCA